jgi:large subunit ribosomal protein L22
MVEENKKIEEKEEAKLEETKEKKPVKMEEKKVKESAQVKGYDLDISTKHAIAICDFIRGKEIEKAIKDLDDVLKYKKAVPMKREVPHRKGIERGRYPIKAAKTIIKLLKSLNANSSISEIENPIITFTKADKASRPYRRWGSRRFKRTHITIIAKGKNKLTEKKNKK